MSLLRPSAHRRAIGPLAALLLLGAAAWPATPAARAELPPLAVVISAQTGVRSVSKAQLRRCFMGSLIEVSGVRLVPLNQPAGSAARRMFDRAILGMSEQASQRFWIDSLIRDGKRAPRATNNPRLLTKVVKKLRGAIGYVDAATVAGDAQLHSLVIDGASVGEERYPLR